MENFWVGALGALAPEILRWRRITRSETPREWSQCPYWLATIAYVLLGGFMADLIAQPEAYAAFLTGLTTEYAIAGAMTKAQEGIGVEELGMKSATKADLVLASLRRHANYLTQYG